MQAQRLTRAELHEQVAALKAAGLTFDGIARMLGRARSSVTAAYYDPTGEVDRARKRKRSSPCIDCGKAVSNSGSAPPDRCQPCHTRYTRTVEGRFRGAVPEAAQRWTNAQIIAAVRANPTVRSYKAAHDLDPSGSPAVRTITTRFGKWNAALEAAGLPVLHPRPEYAGRLTREGALLAIEECARELGALPSFSQYAAWARRVGAPSGAHVRGVTGGWGEAVLEVEASMEPPIGS